MMTTIPKRGFFAKLAAQAALAVGVAVGAGSASADLIVDWDLGCNTPAAHSPVCVQNTAYASPHAFSSIGGVNHASGILLDAYGFNEVAGLANDTPHTLFSKFTLGDPTETGLGLVNPGNNEINGAGQGTPIQYVDLVPHIAGSFTLVVSSVQGGESFQVYLTSAIGDGSVGGANLGQGVCLGTICTQTISVALGQTVAVRGLTGDVLVETFTTTIPNITVPEPATIALLGLGLIAAGLARRRRQ